MRFFIPFYDDELKQQYYVVQLEQELAKGTAELEIEWTGDLTGTLVGINKVTYTDGGKHVIHLEVVHAKSIRCYITLQDRILCFLLHKIQIQELRNILLQQSLSQHMPVKLFHALMSPP